jgi:hypothetical protein
LGTIELIHDELGLYILDIGFELLFNLIVLY